MVHTLKKAGYEAYVVGGAVRDLLLGLRPKDFDVATSATPEQVKSLFRRAFIIGRRFRIVHVIYGRGREHEVIEVSTMRAYLDSADAEQVKGNERTSKGELSGMKHAVDASGRVLRDNVWGPIEQDAARRDFSINAMYYDPETQIVVDFHHGIRDSKKKTLRMIGDAATRYREDPVRIIRAVRFAAKLNALGFKIDTKTLEPLVASRNLLADVPQSRLFDEMLKLLQTGHSLASIEQLKATGPGHRHLPAARRGGGAGQRSVREAGAARHRPPRGRRQAGGAQLLAGLRVVGRCAQGLGAAPAHRAATSARRRLLPPCKRPWTMPLTAALAMSPAAASWARTCAKSG